MQKTCKNEYCKRKLEKTSLSDCCLACSHMYGQNQTQTQRGNENTSRQTEQRSSIFENNRQLADLVFPPPAVSAAVASTSFQFTTALPSSRSTPVPTTTTMAGGVPVPVSQSSDRIDLLLKKIQELEVKNLTNKTRLEALEN